MDPLDKTLPTTGAKPHVVGAALQRYFDRIRPGFRVVATSRMGPDDTRKSDDDTTKATGYGDPLLITTRSPEGSHERFVLHTVSANSFGHDRRADRAAAVLLAYDTSNAIPSHVAAVHVGGFARSGELLALDHIEELFWITHYAPGNLYADELRELAQRRECNSDNCRRAEALGAYLAALHEPVDNPIAYVRSIRDLVGSGEGIFGIVDDYAADVPGASRRRLQNIELGCVQQRWALRAKPARLVRIHGDFHPFNIVFGDDNKLVLLDASRGCLGDAADDLTALAINYLFFALQHPGTWRNVFLPLWSAFFHSYFAQRPDDDVLTAAPAFFAWRALVLCSPRWYPDLTPAARDTLLTIAERALSDGHLDLMAIAKLPL